MSPVIDHITRADLLELIRRQTRSSSFERLTTTSVLDHVAAAEKKAAAAAAAKKPSAKTTKKKKVPDVKIGGGASNAAYRYQPNGMYFSVALSFALAHQGTKSPSGGSQGTVSPKLTKDEIADWGTGFGNPLVNPKKNCIYVVRATISQLRTDPMIGGFKLKWIAPAGWSRWDPLPLTMLVEASSNPLIISRKFKSPDHKATNAVFRCRVVAWYP